MQIVTVKPTPPDTQGKRGYNIYIGTGLLEQAGLLLKENGLHDKAVIITDQRVYSIHGSLLLQALERDQFQVTVLRIEPGENQKSLETAGRLYEALTDANAERSTPIIALGGGVIGDLAGFVAATYMRGVPLVQIPTTVLAQADSSLGGKTAVNHKNIKNMIGTFYPPSLTIADINTLKTLSERELNAGLAEVIKYGIILDKRFFEYLELNIGNIQKQDNNVLETIIVKAASYKADIVAQDPYDRGIRNILNFGHTIGHAVETASHLSIWHGEAVAIGMVAEARIAQEVGLLSGNAIERIINLLKSAGLPTALPTFSGGKLLDIMRHDKKVADGKIRFILPTEIGAVKMTDEVPVNIFEKVAGNKR
jgi:3-dehydroquinate synthase